MPRIKKANRSITDVDTNLKFLNVNSIQQQINNKRIEYINIKNAVKILEDYSNWNGYIKLYTEIENNFEVDDIIYITYMDGDIDSGTTVFNLENPSTPLTDFYLGYKILFVNRIKNEIVINRHYNDITNGAKLKFQYLSKVSCRGGNFIGDISDGVVFRDCKIFSNDFGELTGTIYEETIGGTIPVSGVTIYSSGLSTISDINGEYLISLPAGINMMQYIITGYISQTHNIDIIKWS